MNGDAENPGGRMQGQSKNPAAARKRKKWSEQSPGRRVRIVVQMLVQLSLTAWTLWDLKRRPASQINGDKRWWTFGAFVQPFGPIAYIIFGRKR
jgi:hypothetical protein